MFTYHDYSSIDLWKCMVVISWGLLSLIKLYVLNRNSMTCNILVRIYSAPSSIGHLYIFLPKLLHFYLF
ncbi:hypothetical protein V3C99_019197 [Haemonchus contortus]|uniref:Ovule protein n=1 Tax=Haemonchus contortus TaxID=6289 RepID=A0A7I4Z0X4_HAECO